MRSVFIAFRSIIIIIKIPTLPVVNKTVPVIVNSITRLILTIGIYSGFTGIHPHISYQIFVSPIYAAVNHRNQHRGISCFGVPRCRSLDFLHSP